MKKLLEILEEKRFLMFKKVFFSIFSIKIKLLETLLSVYPTAHIFYKKVFFNFVVKCI